MREIFYMLAVLSMICATSGAVLVNLKQATKDRIEQQVLTYVQGPALLTVLKFRDNDPIAERVKIGDVNVFPAMKDGKLAGVAFETFAPGYSGDIGVMVGIDVEKDELLGIGITTQTETPGLGTRILEPAFTTQFTAHGLESMNLKSKGGDIDAVSGATFSSVGTVDAVRKAIEIYQGIKPEIIKTWKNS
ncbi:RnfABCDGE type electron transport complex subunit G [Desulfocurvibacter africanus]|uniref:Ion-translocating oxidoreductase complex subunit G n=1 Tax=Desulfocurvibacter africanus subsp. africanus str. Walvis Bay TaxID=690850 RepID=F3Z438_DESAF|nr:RnfABCDGE type electron transport complex subunit G [Desulfocurvibacter africanus]EGJ51580.1 electron transport complex, RnfABCDGE type, G subunit [Desulfocurvibacter africanus subsp. africanus str. Walvis Bay]